MAILFGPVTAILPKGGTALVEFNVSRANAPGASRVAVAVLHSPCSFGTLLLEAGALTENSDIFGWLILSKVRQRLAE
jgi:hypothetical protein